MDWSDFIQYIILIFVGFVSGFINTVAGGGSLLSVSVLIFMGLPGTVANGTNRIAILVQNVFAAEGFCHKGIVLPLPYTYYLSGVSLVGGFIGVYLSVTLSDTIFNKILSIVVLLSLVSILAAPLQKETQNKEKMSMPKQIIGSIIFFVLGIYGGFLQAGIGFLVLITLSHLHNFTLVKTNYLKVFSAIFYTGISVIIFSFEGKIIWSIGVFLTIGQGVGGWYASQWSVEKGDKWIKKILAVIMIPIAIKLWFFHSW